MPKTAVLLKILILLLIFFTLSVNIIYLVYPVNYLSYATGYSTETISIFVKQEYNIVTLSDHEKLCSLADLKFILKSYMNLEAFSFSITGITAAIGIVYLFAFRKTLSKKFIFGILFTLIFLFIICLYAYIMEFGLFFTECQ